MSPRPTAPPVRTPPEPLPVDARRVILIGTVVWVVAAAVTAILWSAGHPAQWFWTCVAASVLGGAGLLLIGKHHAEGRV